MSQSMLDIAGKSYEKEKRKKKEGCFSVHVNHWSYFIFHRVYCRGSKERGKNHYEWRHGPRIPFANT
jgi:hypothetical protein